MSIAAGCFPAT